jgi:hypothetical protein
VDDVVILFVCLLCLFLIAIVWIITALPGI